MNWNHPVWIAGDLTTNNKLSSPSSKCAFEFSELCASLSPLFSFLFSMRLFLFFFVGRKYHGGYSSRIKKNILKSGSGR